MPDSPFQVSLEKNKSFLTGKANVTLNVTGAMAPSFSSGRAVEARDTDVVLKAATRFSYWRRS